MDNQELSPSELKAEAERLIRTGQMPSLDELLEAVNYTRLKYGRCAISLRKSERIQ